jgi:hypothetical protein
MKLKALVIVLVVVATLVVAYYTAVIYLGLRLLKSICP